MKAPNRKKAACPIEIWPVKPTRMLRPSAAIEKMPIWIRIDSQYLHWGNLYEIAPFYVLIIILMIKPYGLFGTKDIERV